MSWQQLTLSVLKPQIDVLCDWLTDQGAASISLCPPDDTALFQLDPGCTEYADIMTLSALFDASQDLKPLVNELKRSDWLAPESTCQYEPLADRDWVRETQRQFKPQAFGTLWVVPNWSEPHKDWKHIIRLDPGLAFGTGTHETTQLCLHWLAENPPTGKTVIDYGCGSGILSLAAARLGATQVIAVDHDPMAIDATQQNCQINPDFSSLIQYHLTDKAIEQPAERVMANILAAPLCALCPTLTAATAPEGELLLSGLLDKDVSMITEHYQAHFTLIDLAQSGEWLRMVWKRNKLI